ncbi:hypothetical protein [Pyrobaculum sp.]|uniref:hypothetical protein n=1 Tax=Pyrobaculum sp. TaxID=2004705 RepID=UPI00316BFB03
MPDLLAHYAAGLLVASRFVDVRRAFLLAFLPDVDALLGVYRWVASGHDCAGIAGSV